VEKRIGEELVVLVLDVDPIALLTIDSPYFITRKRLHLPYISHLHLYQLPTLLSLFLLILLLSQRLLILPLHPNQIIKHPVGGQEHVLHALVIDTHGSIEQLRGKLPEAHVGPLGELGVDDSNRYFEGISRVNFLH
jgi:hypothetical protein